MLLSPTCWTPASEQITRLVQEELASALIEFAQYNSLAAVQALPAYRAKQASIEQVLGFRDEGSFAEKPARAKPAYRFVAWNLERGIELDGQIDAFQTHPYLREADVILVTEADLGMARSGNRAVAQTLAQALGFHYVFATCYWNLAKGAGIEHDSEGENLTGLLGNAILSRYPIRRVRPVHLVNGKDKMSTREKRLGCETAIVAEIDFPGFAVETASIHLDAHSAQRHRHDQMKDVLHRVRAGLPAVIGGDWNTTTYNSSRAVHSILGFWFRLFLGIDNVIRNHYLRPYNRFERDLFDLLERQGFDYKACNQLDGYTASYDINDPKDLKNLREWIPAWCIPFIEWALSSYDGKCPFKIDWFAARGVETRDPVVLHEFRERRERPLSDHDPIGVEVLAPA